MDRRGFLKGAAWFTVVNAGGMLSACGGHNGSAPAPAAAGGSTTGGSFALGVASGDPRENSIVFWTRCTPDAGSSPVGLRLEVATDAGFANLAATAELSAVAAFDYTVRVKVTGLAPATRYNYRFVSGGKISAVGQAKTAPAAAASPQQLRFAWMSCQDWSVNHWAAMELMAAEDLDFIVHLGDYIYETVDLAFDPVAAEPAHRKLSLPNGSALPGNQVYATSLEDYRTLYRTYRSDARLQELHRKFAMIAIWDDHEFSDDCWQDHQTYTNENQRQTARRRNANQAWAEYLPVDWGDVSFDLNNPAYNNIRIYRDFRFGNLMHLLMTDERLYRDDHVVNQAAFAQSLGHDPVNGDDAVGSRYFVAQPLLQQFEALDAAALGRTPSILGTTQAQWWKDALKASNATWKIWGNEVPLNRMWLDLRGLTPPPLNQLFIVDADAWDGYPSHRAELMSFLKAQNIGNVVAISGDVHAFQCGVVRDNPDPALGTPVALDLVGAGISSTAFFQVLQARLGSSPLSRLLPAAAAFDALLRANNPDLAFVDLDAQGYASATLTPGALTVLFNKVKPLNADGSKPAQPLAKRTRITLQAGLLAPRIEDNVG